MKISKFQLFIYFIYLLLFIILIFFFNFINRTLIYKNYLKDCENDKFCGIQIINIHLPNEYNYRLKEIAINKGVRIEIHGKKKQKNISYDILYKELNEIESWYKSIAYTISNIVGEKIIPLDKKYKNRLSLIVYDKEGDYIDWHFDTNHFEGRYFTLLVPITFEKTCGNYVYKDKNGNDTSIHLEKNQAIFFEGDKVFHSGKKLCSNQFRAILSMTFITNSNMNSWNYIMNSMKEFGVFGN
jgi:hypothetical protein